MSKQKSLKRLSKSISYVLGRNPAEFGLVLDPDGFVKIKELLKALGEEEGLRYVRRSDIDEILITVPDAPIEIQGNHIRSKHRQPPPGDILAQNLPKLLYTCVRRKAYANVLEKGIFPMGFSHVILSSEPQMAERMGRRKDAAPILLIVHTDKSTNHGILFYEAGESLYLAHSIPPGCFTGPLLPKPKEAVKKREVPEKQIVMKMPGSFLMEAKAKKTDNKRSKQRAKGRETAMEKDQKTIRKQKRQRERPPWRQ